MDRGIGIYSYIYTDLHFGSENMIRPSDKGDDEAETPNYN